MTFSRIAHENQQELIFQGSQVDLGGPQEYLSLREVDAEIIGCENRFLPAACLHLGMAYSDTDPGKKFTHAKGLREVVVGAGVERTDLVALLLPRGDDDDRNP